MTEGILFITLFFPSINNVTIIAESSALYKDVHNVRKWPNLCSVGLGMFRKSIVKPLGQIEWVLKHSLVRTAKSNI